jgi:hypothetical protein
MNDYGLDEQASTYSMNTNGSLIILIIVIVFSIFITTTAAATATATALHLPALFLHLQTRQRVANFVRFSVVFSFIFLGLIVHWHIIYKFILFRKTHIRSN